MLALFALLAPHVSRLILAACAAAVVLAVAIADNRHLGAVSGQGERADSAEAPELGG